MRLLAAIPVFVALLSLSSCILGGGTKTPKTPVVPAALDPNAVKQPAPPPLLSSPQTDIQLPPPQALSPEALASIQVPQPPAPEPPPPAKAPPSKKQPPVAAAPKPETAPESTAPVPAPPPAGPATPVVPPEEQPRLQPLYSEEEKRRVLAELEKRKNETEGLLRGLNSNRLSADQKTSVDRVRSFMNVADDAAKRGDLHSADAFSLRALVLARELASGR